MHVLTGLHYMSLLTCDTLCWNPSIFCRLFIIIQWSQSKRFLENNICPTNEHLNPTLYGLDLFLAVFVLDTKQPACAEIMADKVHTCSTTSRPRVRVGPTYRTLDKALRTRARATSAVYFQCVLCAFLSYGMCPPLDKISEFSTTLLKHAGRARGVKPNHVFQSTDWGWLFYSTMVAKSLWLLVGFYLVWFGRVIFHLGIACIKLYTKIQAIMVYGDFNSISQALFSLFFSSFLRIKRPWKPEADYAVDQSGLGVKRGILLVRLTRKEPTKVRTKEKPLTSQGGWARQRTNARCRPDSCLRRLSKRPPAREPCRRSASSAGRWIWTRWTTHISTAAWRQPSAPGRSKACGPNLTRGPGRRFITTAKPAKAPR